MVLLGTSPFVSRLAIVFLFFRNAAVAPGHIRVPVASPLPVAIGKNLPVEKLPLFVTKAALRPIVELRL